MSNTLNNNTLGGGITPLLLRRRMMMQQSSGYEVVWNQIMHIPNRYQAAIPTSLCVFIESPTGSHRDAVILGHIYYINTLERMEEGSYTGNFTPYLGGAGCIIPWGGLSYANNYKYLGAALDSVGESFEDVACRLYNNSAAAQANTDIISIWPYMIDLTTMFGSGNEPSTVAEFEAWLTENGINPNEYIPYCAGETRKMTKPSWLQ